MRVVPSMMGVVLLSGCMAASGPPPAGDAQPDSRLCDASAVQSFVGQQATEQTGAQILAQSGARSLRWGAPNSAWTMDFREDRVNVRYDEQMAITTISCG